MATPTLERYRRHAQRFGCEMVFELAAGLVWPFRADLPPRELGQLALYLRRLDRSWRLPGGNVKGMRVLALRPIDLATMLVGDGVPEARACEMAGVSRRALQRRQSIARQLLQREAQSPDQGSETLVSWGQSATNPTPEGCRPRVGDLSLQGA